MGVSDIGNHVSVVPLHDEHVDDAAVGEEHCGTHPHALLWGRRAHEEGCEQPVAESCTVWRRSFYQHFWNKG